MVFSKTDFTEGTVRSKDGTTVGYHKIGAGPALAVSHGTLRTGMDYEKLARALATSFTVYLIDRRGREGSGSQGDDYTIEKEVQDIKAVMDASGASLLFGHSFGGLMCLEFALTDYPLVKLALYEPALSINHSISTASLPEIKEALADNNFLGAFVGLLKSIDNDTPSEQLPAFAKMVSESPAWPSMERLLPTVPAELEIVSRLDSMYHKYKAITTSILLMRGNPTTTDAVESIDALSKTLLTNKVVIMPGVGHNAPDMEAPEAVAKILVDFFKEI
jgi:pimeloyl-ACP methyl ester carboxylesterase